jgi:hypothetical protein
VSEFRETALPCSRETIVACVSHLCRTPALARRTILTRIAAINAAHLDADLPLPAAGAARKQLGLIVACQPAMNSSSARRSRSLQRRQRSRKLGPAGQAGLAVVGKFGPNPALLARNHRSLRLTPLPHAGTRPESRRWRADRAAFRGASDCANCGPPGRPGFAAEGQKGRRGYTSPLRDAARSTRRLQRFERVLQALGFGMSVVVTDKVLPPHRTFTDPFRLAPGLFSRDGRSYDGCLRVRDWDAAGAPFGDEGALDVLYPGESVQFPVEIPLPKE